MKRLLITGLVAYVGLTTVAAAEFDRTKYPYPNRASLGCSIGSAVVDQYTGNTVSCNRVDVDHRISLKEAYDAGMSDEDLKKLSKDPRNLVLTDQSVNRSKGAKGSEAFAQQLKNNGQYNDNRYNKNMRNVISLKQTYNIPLTEFERTTAFKLTGKSPKVWRWKTVKGLSKSAATKKVAKEMAKPEKMIKRIASKIPFLGPLSVVVIGGFTAYEVYEVQKLVREYMADRSARVQEDAQTPMLSYFDDKPQITSLWERIVAFFTNLFS